MKYNKFAALTALALLVAAVILAIITANLFRAGNPVGLLFLHLTIAAACASFAAACASER